MSLQTSNKINETDNCLSGRQTSSQPSVKVRILLHSALALSHISEVFYYVKISSTKLNRTLLILKSY